MEEAVALIHHRLARVQEMLEFLTKKHEEHDGQMTELDEILQWETFTPGADEMTELTLQRHKRVAVTPRPPRYPPPAHILEQGRGV